MLPTNKGGYAVEGLTPNYVIEEIDRLHADYEKEIEKLRKTGILSGSNADAFLFHSRNFVIWCKDRGISPINTREVSNVKGRDKRVQVEDALLEKEHKVAYYFSRFEHDILYPKYTQEKAFEKASEILGVKKNTLKNKRDLFDPFVNDLKERGNRRKGWHQKGKLSDAMEKVFSRYLHMDETDIEKEIREILGI